MQFTGMKNKSQHISVLACYQSFVCPDTIHAHIMISVTNAPTNAPRINVSILPPCLQIHNKNFRLDNIQSLMCIFPFLLPFFISAISLSFLFLIFPVHLQCLSNKLVKNKDKENKQLYTQLKVHK